MPSLGTLIFQDNPPQSEAITPEADKSEKNISCSLRVVRKAGQTENALMPAAVDVDVDSSTAFRGLGGGAHSKLPTVITYDRWYNMINVWAQPNRFSSPMARPGAVMRNDKVDPVRTT